MRLFFSFLFSLYILNCYGLQEIEIVSFKMVPSDLSARVEQRDDNYGTPCALLKVQIPLSDVRFIGDVIGEVKFKLNEYWVYLPHNTSLIEIRHHECFPLKINIKNLLTTPLETKTTYELCLLKKEKDAPGLYNEGMIELARGNIANACNSLIKAADSNYNPALYELGKIGFVPYLEISSGYNPNPIEVYRNAYYYYTKASQMDNYKAKYSLAKLLQKLKRFDEFKGFEHDCNYYWAIEELQIEKSQLDSSYVWSLIKDAADHGIEDAQWDMIVDLQWCKENALKGVAIAEFGMGVRCDTIIKDDWNAEEDFLKMPEIMRSQPGLELVRHTNLSEAFRWYQKSAQHGLDAAQWKLGYMYAFGRGTTKDIAKALEWRENAASQGDVIFQFELAISYLYGNICDYGTRLSGSTELSGGEYAEIPVDIEKANFWLKKVNNTEKKPEEDYVIGANGMYTIAVEELAEVLKKKGRHNDALYWYQNYTSFDHKVKMGEEYLEGIHVTKDYNMARRYFEETVNDRYWKDLGEGNRSAYHLGVIYKEGYGVQKDLNKAKFYFLKGGVYPKALCELSMIYINEGKYELARKVLESLQSEEICDEAMKAYKALEEKLND